MASETHSTLVWDEMKGTCHSRRSRLSTRRWNTAWDTVRERYVSTSEVLLTYTFHGNKGHNMATGHSRSSDTSSVMVSKVGGSDCRWERAPRTLGRPGLVPHRRLPEPCSETSKLTSAVNPTSPNAPRNVPFTSNWEPRSPKFQTEKRVFSEFPLVQGTWTTHVDRFSRSPPYVRREWFENVR